MSLSTRWPIISRGAELTPFRRDLLVKSNLQQEISQFLLDPLWIARVQRFQELIGLLQKLGTQAGVGLGTIPGAAIGSPQTGHDLLKGLR